MTFALPGRPSTVRTGARAEDVALRFLESRGLRPIERNFRCRAGELDLVMLEKEELVIVEVRYRATDDPVDPVFTVSARKRRRVLRAAARFLQLRQEFADHPLRFDVLAMTGPLDRPRCEWIRCAFTADDTGGF